MSTHETTRRVVMRGAATLPAIIAALPTAAIAGAGDTAGGGDDAKLLRLYEDLRRAWAAERAISADNAQPDEAVTEACNRCAAIVDEIEQCCAHRIEGLRVKAIAVLWCHNGELLQLADGPTTDVRLAQSIVRNLLGV